MPTILPFVRGDATNKAKGAAQGAAKKGSSGSSSGGMKGLQAKLGGGGGNKGPSPAEQISELAGKRLVPGHSLPHITLHTVQVRSFVECVAVVGRVLCVPASSPQTV